MYINCLDRRGFGVTWEDVPTQDFTFEHSFKRQTGVCLKDKKFLVKAKPFQVQGCET